MPEPCPLGCSLDEARDVSHNEGGVILSDLNNSQRGSNRRKRVRSHLRTGGAEGRNERRLARIGEAKQADISEKLELKLKLELKGWSSRLKASWSAMS